MWHRAALRAPRLDEYLRQRGSARMCKAGSIASMNHHQRRRPPQPLARAQSRARGRQRCPAPQARAALRIAPSQPRPHRREPRPEPRMSYSIRRARFLAAALPGVILRSLQASALRSPGTAVAMISMRARVCGRSNGRATTVASTLRVVCGCVLEQTVRASVERTLRRPLSDVIAEPFTA